MNFAYFVVFLKRIPYTRIMVVYGPSNLLEVTILFLCLTYNTYMQNMRKNLIYVFSRLEFV